VVKMVKTTSVRLDRELHKEVKIYYILKNTTITELITKVLTKELETKGVLSRLKKILEK